MTQIQINSITGSAYPYTLYACDVYGNQCVLIATIPSTVTFPLIITLPPQFNGAPAVGLKMIDSVGCELFGIFYCEGTNTAKIFEDGEIFLFMDAEIFIFQDQ
jgi:hypothetical protein